MNSYNIIDVHAHIFPEKIREKAVGAIGNFYDFHPMHCVGSAEDLVEEMEKASIGRAVIHSVATVPRQVVSINDFILAEVAKYPDKLIGFATLHPAMERPEEEIERAISLGFSGFKLHPDFQQVDIDAEESKNLFRLIAGRKPILIHMGDATRTYSKPERLAAVAKEFPEQIFIGAHFGGYQAWDDSEKYLIGKAENVLIDTSSSLFALSPERAVDMIRRHGITRVVFGTDYPMWNPTEEMGRFMNLALTEEERRLILSGNLLRVLGQ